MSVNYKAQIVVGFELTDDWNEIVSEEFYEKYEEYFIETSSWGRCDGPQIFGVVVDEVDEGRFIEYSNYITVEDNDILNEFIFTYPEAAMYHSRSNYLICKED